MTKEKKKHLPTCALHAKKTIGWLEGGEINFNPVIINRPVRAAMYRDGEWIVQPNGVIEYHNMEP